MIPLAHAGGVDEIAMLLLPAVVFFFILQFRRKRLEAKDQAEAARDQTEDPSGR
ncbi:MAG: hypothetical protein ACRDKG_04650 [Actinomycetota bacterium]